MTCDDPTIAVALRPADRGRGSIRRPASSRRMLLPAILALLICQTVSLAAEPARVHQCDRMSAHPIDDERVAPAVDDLTFLAEFALVECRNAVAAYPDEPRFHFQLGRALLALGKGDEGMEALRIAGDKGYASASLVLGRIFESGSHVEADLDKAFEHYRSAAEQGHREAQIGIGMMYLEGRSVAVDFDQAFHWFSEAAEQGHPYGHFFLGSMYLNGERRIAGDDDFQLGLELAARHLEVAAEAGIPAAQFVLGNSYVRGLGVDENTARGLALLEAAAEQGFIIAALELGRLYMGDELFGEYVIQPDREKAMDWYCRAGSVGQTLFQEFHEEELVCRDDL